MDTNRKNNYAAIFNSEKKNRQFRHKLRNTGEKHQPLLSREGVARENEYSLTHALRVEKMLFYSAIYVYIDQRTRDQLEGGCYFKNKNT